jgi:starch phosphorylase
MKAAMKAICPVFNTDRMVHQYMERFYHPAAERTERLAADGAARALALAEWKALLREHWAKVRVESVEADSQRALTVGAALKVWARVFLGPLRPEDVSVEIYRGQVDAKGAIVEGQGLRMKWAQADGGGRHTFIGEIPCQTSGLHGYTLRILPHHEDLIHPFEPGLIYWQAKG